jgi:hypothetical protein
MLVIPAALLLSHVSQTSPFAPYKQTRNFAPYKQTRNDSVSPVTVNGTDLATITASHPAWIRWLVSKASYGP